jgi:hypothetical protein
VSSPKPLSSKKAKISAPLPWRHSECSHSPAIGFKTPVVAETLGHVVAQDRLTQPSQQVVGAVKLGHQIEQVALGLVVKPGDAGHGLGIRVGRRSDRRLLNISYSLMNFAA